MVSQIIHTADIYISAIVAMFIMAVSDHTSDMQRSCCGLSAGKRIGPTTLQREVQGPSSVATVVRQLHLYVEPWSEKCVLCGEDVYRGQKLDFRY